MTTEVRTYPLGPMAQGIYFDAVTDPPPGLDFIQFANVLPEKLDPLRLWMALVDATARYEVLRTSLATNAQGDPIQVVHPHVTPRFTFQDWRGIPREKAASALAERRMRERARGFDLSDAPLLAMTVIQLEDDVFFVGVATHHVLLDGRGLFQLMWELFTDHDESLQGRPCQWPQTTPYHRYVEWVEAQNWEASRTYWKEMLAGFHEPSDLVLHSHPENPDAVALIRIRKHLDLDTSNRLNLLRSTGSYTLNNIFMAVWAVLLHRYSGKNDLVFGVVRSGRHGTVQGSQTMVGMTINTLPMRVSLSPEMSLAQLAAQLRDKWLAMRPHEHTPPAIVQASRETQRDVPLYNTAVVFERKNWRDYWDDLGGKWKKRQLDYDMLTRLPITLYGYGGSLINMTLDTHPGHYNRADASRVLSHVGCFLRAFAEDPDQRIFQVPLLTDEEKTRYLYELNRSHLPYPHDLDFASMMERQSAVLAHKEAVIFQDQVLTGAQLEAQANALAWRLRRQGVGPETVVGVFLSRGPMQVVSIYAIWKAGGTYMGLDPTYPQQRLSFMVGDSNCAWVLCEKALGPPPDYVGEILYPAETVAESSSEGAPPRLHGPQNAAYIIYTSGSTGKPKGAFGLHGASANLMLCHRDVLGIRAEDRVLQFFSLCFDASIFELAMQGLGASLVLVPYELTLNPLQLGRYLVDQKVSVTILPPSLLAHMPDEVKLRLLITGGEAVSLTLAKHWASRFPYFNAYGPTEASVVTSAKRLDPLSDEVPSIGKPIPHVNVFILDGMLRALPVGVPGELYVGGPCLSRGYLARPALTAERFIPRTHGQHQPGERLYRTGDRCRLDAEGNIHFMGRLDFQIKLRGFRIEAGEIEALLNSHHQVRESLVTVVNEENEAFLVAYLIANGEEQVEAHLLKEHLAALPGYMVPSQFVWLSQWPTTPNGKVDRRALPKPSWERTHSYEPPSTPTEINLHRIWCQVLDLDQIGIHENFFELGGHSLLMGRILGSITSQLGISLPARTLFLAPTLASLAIRVEAESAADPQGLPPVIPVTRSEPPPPSPAQEHLWFLDRLSGGNIAYNLPLVQQLEGALDSRALERALDTIIARHEALRTGFPDRGGKPFQDIRAHKPFRLTTVDLSGLPEEAATAHARHLGCNLLRQQIHVATAPLLRILLVRVSSQSAVFVVSKHHIISDGSSVAVFLQELTQLYQGICKTGEAELPPLPVQFADYSHWQRERLKEDRITGQVDWWRETLKDAPPLLNLPTDRQRPEVSTINGSLVQQTIPHALYQAVKSEARAHQLTPFMVLTAAFKALLHRYTGQDDILLGTPSAGRDREETAALIGFLVNTIVLRTRMGMDLTRGQLLEQVRETVLAALAHQQVPFATLVEELKPKRDRRYNPLFQVMFSLNQEPPPAQLASEGNRLMYLDRGTTQFDWNFMVSERSEGALLVIEYNSDLFDKATIERMLKDYLCLLEERSHQINLQQWLAPIAVPKGFTIAPETEAPGDRRAAAQARKDRLGARRKNLSAAQKALLAKKLGGK